MKLLSEVGSRFIRDKNHLYHGTKARGLTALAPEVDADGGECLLYATSEAVFAAIFANRSAGSLVQAWGRDPLTKIPYLVERKEGIIEANYAGQPGSIYAVPRTSFYQRDDFWEEEWVSACTTEVVAELRLTDIGQYLWESERYGDLLIVPFRDRREHFAGSDEALIQAALSLLGKYGPEVLGQIQEYHSEIYDDVLRRLSAKQLT